MPRFLFAFSLVAVKCRALVVVDSFAVKCRALVVVDSFANGFLTDLLYKSTQRESHTSIRE
jgi:hypothetical protein